MDTAAEVAHGALAPPGGGGPAIHARGLVKRFGSTTAVAGIDLTVARGTVYGLLGPNGAGKTTTVRILATLIAPDGGAARVLGHDVVAEAAAVRRRVSLTGQVATVDEDLTGAENLVLLGRLAGLSRAAARNRASDLLDAFGLAKAASRQAKAYSGGMRRRLDLAASILVQADLYFLDEPTTGLDPASRAQVWDIIRAVAADGAAVLLTTQDLDEADQLADRVAVIDRGTIVAEGTTSELKAATGAGTIHIRLADPASRPEAARRLTDADPKSVATLLDHGQAGVARIPGKHGGEPREFTVVQVVIRDEPGELTRLFDAAGAAGVNIEDVRIEHSPGLPVGVAELSVRPAEAGTLLDALEAGGWPVRR